MLSTSLLKLSANNQFLATTNDKPFFWLADTWWYGLTDRAAWPEPFQDLVKKRVEQGFTVAMVVVGVPPEVPIESNEARSDGQHPFLENFEPNPAYFSAIKKKVAYMVEHGLVPCIVGGWGPQIQVIGRHNMECFWREIIHHLSDYPVVWCLTGEVDLFTVSTSTQSQKHKLVSFLPESIKRVLRKLKPVLAPASPPYHAQVDDWRAVAEKIIETDDSQHLLIVHPHSQQPSSKVMGKPSWLKIDSIQSGHSTDSALFLTEQALLRSKEMPFINLEPLYEGILGNDDPAFQRYAFWMSILAGAKGHTYGADGLWNMRADDHFLGHWGQTTWKVALQRPGAEQLGLAKKWLEKHCDWWTLKPSLHSVTPHWQASLDRVQLPFCAKAAQDTFLCYFPEPRPTLTYSWKHSGSWQFSWIDPSTMTSVQVNSVSAKASTPLILPRHNGDLLLFAQKK
ncbi:DUF4038 domain-containing protein [Patescibacteria group bacterium]|nr:DUF4038 domain-containing protein [Patescibacteria group bacterium]